MPYHAPVACGYAHTLALAERGSAVFACGQGLQGQLGDGTRRSEYTPVLVAARTGASGIVAVAAGERHSALVTSTGKLQMWGWNERGQLGQDDTRDRHTPVVVEVELGVGNPVAMVACGDSHTLVVTQAGLLFVFGNGSDGQLGLGDTDDTKVPVPLDPARFGGETIAQAAAGSEHSAVVTSGGSVWTWGGNEWGGLGHNNFEWEFAPRKLVGQFGGARAASLAARCFYTMLVTACGEVWSWGDNETGQLGVGDHMDRLAPVRVGGEETFGSSKVRMVACGYGHAVAVTQAGALWIWGRGYFSNLDHNALVPVRVPQEHFGGATILSASAGAHHTVAVSEDGALFSWGHADEDGLPTGLGHKSTRYERAPARVEAGPWSRGLARPGPAPITGMRYEGGVDADLNFHGRGTLIFAYGKGYEGEFYKSKRHGRGTFTWRSGTRYEGEFQDDRMHGHGVIECANGDKHAGEFVDNKPHGQGTRIYKQGHSLAARWCDYKSFEGNVCYNFGDGVCYTGPTESNRPHGCGTLVDGTGAAYTGQWVHGKSGPHEIALSRGRWQYKHGGKRPADDTGGESKRAKAT